MKNMESLMAVHQNSEGIIGKFFYYSTSSILIPKTKFIEIGQAFGFPKFKPAQVISSIGFLGAGMIILKSNNMITGLTTSAGVWTTATIGVALGYGYYAGALTVTVLFLSTIILLGRFERKHRATEVIYLEIDDPYKLNEILKSIESIISEGFTYRIFEPKSGIEGNVGLNIVIENRTDMDISKLLELENTVFAVGE